MNKAPPTASGKGNLPIIYLLAMTQFGCVEFLKLVHCLYNFVNLIAWQNG